MNAPPKTLPVAVKEIVTILRTSLWLWLSPTVACTLLAIAFAFVRADTWQASQALWVRDEAAGSLSGRGDFDNSESKKATLETVIELARNHKVVADALRQVGPPADKSALDWPKRTDIDDLSGAVAVVSPQGSELGGTEHIYLTVSDQVPSRAAALAAAIAEQMENRWQELRRAKANSVIQELTRSVQLAERELQVANQRLAALEVKIGSDLGELRSLNDASVGSSTLRTTQQQIATELRQLRQRVVTDQQLLGLLTTSRRSPDNLIAAPSQLLDSQPSLRRLKEGLVDAQLRTANLRGTMNEAHPKVRAAMAAEDEVRDNLRRELQVAVIGLRADLDVSEKLVASLTQQQRIVESRLNELVGMRTHYAKLSADVQHRLRRFEQAKEQLSDANARQEAAATTSLLTVLDQPLVASAPMGPSRKIIVAAGGFGGLSIGFGLVFLLWTANGQPRRRWTDYLRSGRRASDLQGRRESDAATGNAPSRRQSDAASDPHEHPGRSERRAARAMPTSEDPNSGVEHSGFSEAAVSQSVASAVSRDVRLEPPTAVRSATETELTLSESLKRLEQLTAK